MVFHPVCCISDHITLNVISMVWGASCIHRSMKTTLHQPEDLVSPLSSSAYWRCINNTAGEFYHPPLLLAIMLSVILELNGHSNFRIPEVSAYQLSLHVSHLIEMLGRNSETSAKSHARSMRIIVQTVISETHCPAAGCRMSEVSAVFRLLWSPGFG